MINRLTQINGYKSLFLITSLILLLSIPGIQRLSINSDSRIFFADGNLQHQLVQQLEEEFTKNDSLILLLTFENDELFTPETFAAIHFVTEKLWEQDKVHSVNSLTNFHRSQNTNDGIETAYLYDPDKPLDIDEIKQFSRNESRLIGSTLGKNLDTTAIVATLNIDRASEEDLSTVNRWAESIRTELNLLLPHADVFIVGSAAYNLALMDATKKELGSKVPLILAALLILLMFLIRSARLVLSTIYLIIMTTIAVFGLAGWLSIPITPIIAFVPITLFAIVLADAVHLLSTYSAHYRTYPDTRKSMRLSLYDNFHPIFLTSVTTTIGFLCLLLSESPPYQHLGVLCAIGTFIAFLFSAIWFPSWAHLFAPGEEPKITKFTTNNRYLNHPKRTMLATFIVILASTYFISNNYLDERIDLFFDDSWEIKIGSDLLNSKLTGIHRLEYRVPETPNYPIFSPGYIQALKSFRSWAETQSIVANTTGLDQIIYTAFDSFKEAPDESLPNDEKSISQLFLLYELSLPYGSSLSEYINFDRSASRVKVVLHSSSSKEILAFEDRAERWIDDNWPIELRTKAVSLEASFAELNIENSKSLILSTFVGFMIIAAILMAVLKSLKLGLLSVISNLLPALFAFSVWGIIDGQIGLAVSIVTIVTLGIVVDDTIHILSRFNKGIKNGLDAIDAAKQTLETTGKALIITTLVLCICFSFLSLSHFKPNADLGLMSLITLASALAIDLFLLLPMVMMAYSKKQ